MCTYLIGANEVLFHTFPAFSYRRCLVVFRELQLSFRYSIVSVSYQTLNSVKSHPVYASCNDYKTAMAFLLGLCSAYKTWVLERGNSTYNKIFIPAGHMS